MKCAMLVALLLATATTFALADEPAKEPGDLVKAREDYEAEIKAAVDPITAAYLKKLDAMMKAFGAKGDLESAQAVQKEIKSMTAEKTAGPKKVATIVGKWGWGGGPVVVTFREDGSAKASDGPTGKWKYLDKKARKYHVSWSNGTYDRISLSSDNETMQSNSNQGTGRLSHRLPTDEQK